MTAEQSLRAAEFTARYWHQAALGSGHIPFVHAIACISAAIAGETDPNQLGLDPSVHDAFRAALGELDDLIRERCPHCPERLPRNRVDDHVTTAHADLSPCTASIHVRTNDTTYRCAFRVGHNGEYGALHASAYAKRGGRYVWDDEHDGAIPHREPETDANGWTLKDDGIWTLPVDGGTVLMTRQTTPEERARFAEQWATGVKAEASKAGASTTTDGLQQRIAAALREHGMVHLGDQVPADEYDCCAEAALATLEQHLDIGDAEAWCKACRRVWESSAHQCESDAEQRLARTRERVVWVVARHADRIAEEPALVLNALAAHPAIGWCPPGCTGDCEPDPAVMTRAAGLNQTKGGSL